VGGVWRFSRERVARIDLFHEIGYGGRRSGGMTAVKWQVRSTIDASARLSAISFARDLGSEIAGESYGGQLGATWRINPEGIAAHLWFEDNLNELEHSHNQWRVIGVLDLAFQPEVP
jgi:hypothetical protein